MQTRGALHIEAASFRAGCLILAVLLLPMYGCRPTGEPSNLHQFAGQIFGTSFRVKVVGQNLANDDLERLQSVTLAALNDVDAKMSHYRESSEISQLNRWSESQPFSISPETLEVLLHAREISETTGGAFDITVGPLVDAWGFGPPGRAPAAPANTEIERLLESTGWELVHIDRARSTVTKTLPELRVDLSAIAKGFAVDQVCDALDALGTERYMVEVGGEVRTRGLNAQNRPWRIGIERPVPGDQVVDLVVPLTDLAMATSGDYRNYYEVEGQRVSHTIDPRDGKPITHSVASVSVVAPLCVRADAYATGLLVLGPEGFDLAEDLGLAAYFLQRDREGFFVGRMTTAFREILRPGNRDQV